VARKRRAYTLLEVILTMCVLVVAAGVSFPVISGMYGQHRIRAGTDGIRAGFVYARSQAAEEGRRYRFSVVLDKGNFRVAPDDPVYWSGSPPKIDEEHPAFILEDSLPKGVRFTLDGKSADKSGDSILPHVSPGQWTTIATFESDGTAESAQGGAYVAITVSLDDKSGRPMVVTLRGATATSTVKYAEGKQ
jgi:hypothetical protein